MPFDVPTRREIFDQGASDIEVSLPGANPRRPRSVLGVFLTVVSGACHGMWRFLWWITRQFFIDTAEGQFLERWASIWGVARRRATKATGMVDLIGSDGSVIPVGTLLQLSGAGDYEVATSAMIAGGTATAQITAVEGGASGNAAAGARLSLVSPILGVSSEASVADGGLSGGADEEDDESLRRRLLQRIRNPPHGGADFDYERWAEEVAFVRRAFSFPLHAGLGTVGVSFTVNNKPANDPPLPTAEELAQVASYIEAHDEPVTGRRVGRPVTAAVSVFAPQTHPVDFNITLVPDTAEVRAAVEAELRDYILRNQKPGAVLRISNLRAAISASAGEQHHTLNAPAADIQLAATTIPVFNAVTWS